MDIASGEILNEKLVAGVIYDSIHRSMASTDHSESVE
jgi:hypothetical protein